MNRTLLSLVVLTSSIAPLAMPSAARADGPPPTKAAPAEVTRLFERMLGTWSARDVAVEVNGHPRKMTSQVVCAKAPAGALDCTVQTHAPDMNEESTQVVAWDPIGGRVHLFNVSRRDAHDHVGTVEGEVLKLEYDAVRAGQPFHEELSFTFKGAKELVWKNTCTTAGQVVFAAEGTYRK